MRTSDERGSRFETAAGGTFSWLVDGSDFVG
jgi:hypothetical protein